MRLIVECNFQAFLLPPNCDVAAIVEALAGATPVRYQYTPQKNEHWQIDPDAPRFSGIKFVPEENVIEPAPSDGVAKL